MKSYLLLRDNTESGPYTLHEIRQLNLQPLDLVWIENESTCWNYPTEIRELKKHVQAGLQPSVKQQWAKKEPVVSENMAAPVLTTHTTYSDYFNTYEESNRELYSDIKLERDRRRNASVARNVMGLLLVVIGVGMSAFVVKNIVESFASNQLVASAQANEIQSITTESQHNALPSQPAALTPVAENALLTTNVEEEPESPPLTNAKMTVTEQQNNTKPVAAEPAALKEPPVAVEETREPVIVGEPKASENTGEAHEEKEAEVKKPKDIRSSVRLSANKYEVGVFGGISGLELEVVNGSSSALDQATIEVTYLKPNGSVVKTETLQVRNIAAGKSRKISASGSSRGVKVNYRIVNVSSQSET